MAQNYRIYINDNTLHIADLMPKHLKAPQQIEIQGLDFLNFYKQVKDLSGQNYVLIGEDPAKLFKRLKKSCKLVRAAGGLVQNASGEYLFIFRNEKWDLPKGKVEPDEKMKDAAVREVEEECGVEIRSNAGKICKTYHVYIMHGEFVLKKTNWYEMHVDGTPELVPQLEEGITKAVWLRADELGPVLENTFPSIRQVLEEGGLL